MARLSLFVLLWTGMTSAGGAERVVVPEGDDALLPCSLSTKEDLTGQYFDWKKDDQKKKEEVFLYEAGSHYNNGRQGQDKQFNGRVSYSEDKLKNGDASITIKNTTINDRGNYTCDFPLHQPRKTFLIELVVGGELRNRSGEISGAAKPSVKILKQTETWALLLCKVLNARPEPTVKWQDSTGTKPLDEERDVTKSGDHFNVILHATVTKTDNYSCVVTQEDISHQTEAEIDVHLSGAAPEPEESHNKLTTGVVVFGVVGLVVGIVGLVIGFVFWRKARGSGSAANQTY